MLDNIGIDGHKQDSQVCILPHQGEMTEVRIRTTRQQLGELFRGRAQARILLEASTESEWVARRLERLGHEVIVADPNFAPMYATRSKKVKTDRKDARALEEAAKLRMKNGRGFDIYQKPQDRLQVGANDLDLRPCLETSVDIFRG